MGMPKPPKVASRPAGGAVSPPAGYGAEPRSKKCVSKMKKKYLNTRCRIPRTFFWIQTEDFPIVQAF